MKKTAYDFPVTVVCPKCGQRFDEANVRFVNIEEDIFGRDVITFICPNCKDMVKSNRYG